MYGDLIHVGDVLFKDIAAKARFSMLWQLADIFAQDKLLKPHYLFLFETAIVVAKPKGTNFIFRQVCYAASAK